MNPEDGNNASMKLWEMLKLPGHWPMQADLIQWCERMGPAEAAFLLIGGAVYLLYGWYLFKTLVTINAALLGGFIGMRIGGNVGSAVGGFCVGAFVCAAITWPLMKYAVAVMGGVFGALLGASIWNAVGLQLDLCWAGALIGLVGFGMLSFIIFRGSVMMYTSLQGSVMLIFGILGLVYKYQSVGPRVSENMLSQQYLLPLAIFIPALLGLIYQQTQFGQVEAAGGKKK